MAEPTMQVPVSLVKSVRTALGFHVGEQDALYREVDALLSRPNPSAKVTP